MNEKTITGYIALPNTDTDNYLNSIDLEDGAILHSTREAAEAEMRLHPNAFPPSEFSIFKYTRKIEKSE